MDDAKNGQNGNQKTPDNDESTLILLFFHQQSLEDSFPSIINNHWRIQKKTERPRHMEEISLVTRALLGVLGYLLCKIIPKHCWVGFRTY